MLVIRLPPRPTLPIATVLLLKIATSVSRSYSPLPVSPALLTYFNSDDSDLAMSHASLEVKDHYTSSVDRHRFIRTALRACADTARCDCNYLSPFKPQFSPDPDD
jgi:hypothetical protein